MSTKIFIKNIILNNTSQGLQFGSRWLFNITLINVLDISQYGVFSFVYSLSNILLAVLPFGSSVFLINEVKDFKSSKHQLLNAIVISTLLFAVVFGLYFILSPFLFHVKGWEYYSYGIVLSYILSLNLILFSFFKGVGDFAKELKAYSLFFVLLLVLIVYLYFYNTAEKSLHFIFLSLISINVVVFLSTLFFIKKKAFKIKLWKGKKYLQNIFYERRFFGYQEVVTAIYTQSGMLLLFYLLDTETYGYYRALFVIIAPLFLITVSFSQVLLNYLKNLERGLLGRTYRKIQGLSFIVGALLVLLLYYLREHIFKVIKVPFSEQTTLAFSIVLGAALLRFVFSNYEMLLIVLDKQKYRFYIVFVVAVINIALVFSLLPQYGLIGAVSTNFLTYLALLIGLVWISERQLLGKKQA